MKRIWFVLSVVLLLCAVSVFAFAACDDLKTEKVNLKDDNSASSVEGSVALIDAFFAETLKDPDFVVTCTDAEGDVQFVETVKGTDSYTLSQSGAKTYAYVKEGVYYWVAISPDVAEDGSKTDRRDYYCSDETKDYYLASIKSAYDNSYCQFFGCFKLFNVFPEENATIGCKIAPKTEEGVATSTLTLDYAAPGITFKVTALSKENAVQSVHIELTNDRDSSLDRDLTLTFVYGSASIDLPDVDAWEREEAERKQRLADNEQAVAARDEFLSCATGADNVSVTAIDYSTFSTLSETIANGIDYVNHGSYQTYAYTKDGDSYLLKIQNGQKTYKKNADEYGDNVLVWYSLIDAKDDLFETATFSFGEENGTMTYTVKEGNNTLYSISATKAQDIVTQIAIVGVDNNGNSLMLAITLDYEKAELQEPDLSEYARA